MQGALPIYAHERVITNLKRRFDYVFETENRYPGAPSVAPIEIKNDVPFSIKEESIIPINAYHGSLQVFGFRIRKFAYLTDIKHIEAAEIKKLDNLDVLVINALREESHHSHFNLQEALDFVTLVQPKKTYLTHISHHLGFHEEVEKNLPKNVYIAYDNLEITL